MPTVFLGMSGGVDSSLSAVLLQQQGYRVVGVYMKNWSRDLPGSTCPWAEDLADAKRIAVRLGLDFRVYDYEAEYKRRVVDRMLADFRAGRTPNPDVLCNEEIKFGLFFEKALLEGADYIATGHYASSQQGRLCLALDSNKDQTYFLYRISRSAVSRTLFPLENLKKSEVKRLAEQYGLPNAHKKESMGVCFVGEVSMKDFLSEYIDLAPGEIRELESDRVLGAHDGAIFYTLGQRHGLYLGGGLPYYVVKKDLEKNIVYVSKNLNASDLWTDSLTLTDIFIRSSAESKEINRLNGQVFARLRHRAPLVPVKISDADQKSPSLTVKFSEKIKRPAPGQSLVLYSGTEPGATCLGGGIITSSQN